MRLLSLTAGLAVFLAASAALAEPGKTDTFGKGRSGASSGASSSGGGEPGGGGGEGAPLTRDRATTDLEIGDQRGERKPWVVGASLETHHVIRQTDTAGADKNLNYLDIYGEYGITNADSVGIEGGAYQRFIADSGETGFRLDDISAYYTHAFILPEKVRLRVSGRITAPTSFESQHMGIITTPLVTVRADRRFGIFTLDARLRGIAYIVRYREAQGGTPNPEAGLRAVLQGDFEMPFHTPLHFGAQAATGYSWYYNIEGQDNAGRLPAGAGVPMTNSTTDGQPTQQTYGGEIYARYFMPSVYGVRSDLMLAFAQGDPTLGYTSINHDGTDHFYLFNRRSSELYAALSAEYLTSIAARRSSRRDARTPTRRRRRLPAEVVRAIGEVR